MNNLQVEQRAYNLDEALLIGLEEAEKNQITPAFQCIGTLKQNGFHLSTYLCAANNNQLKLSSLGGASGSEPQAKVKALFESLEKSIGISLYKNDLLNQYSFSTASSPSTGFLTKHQLMPKLLLEEGYQKNPYPWIELHQLANKRSMYYPLALIYPFIDEHIASLSNDIGLAIGATRDEAIIHGINQWVERDAYSLFLLKTVLHHNPVPARVIRKNSLPPSIAQIIAAIEQHYDENILVVDISSDNAIPAFVVSFTRQTMLLQPQGFGASLSKEAALKQALYESVQYKERFNENARVYREHNARFFEHSPLLLKAMIGDLQVLVDNNISVEINWDEIPSYCLPNKLSQQIQLMAERLEACQANIYVADLYQSSTGVSVTYTLIPELENFSLIRDAKCVTIKERAWSILNEL
ncbi:hypothetical protein Lqui_2460 [Legionella quinlivanii]|uniref:YcaO domain-containing protein n=1 Tax=Legionella quinlivanii TaxID=45073 RepID=A0A0W0XPE1_9GAMM|nr:YcaO-like family protein [Legionella quinlivanii]KTD46535.1 hypothetical protein Lqui_2460 [Legionella quinlivanii]SEG09981.1 ribosomal protein S12 methylthiotransferase accessory factor [Legionella quinlivanii DSM 21216]STY10223.1 bacteriocin biosynthesis docking scaffold, SagD family [Legionella quinlivanii]